MITARKSHGSWVLLTLAGALATLIVTWWPVIALTWVRPGPLPDAQLVERLRTVPSDEVLGELAAMAVPTGPLVVRSREIAIAEAEHALRGLIEIDGVERSVTMPFEPDAGLYSHEVWRLWLCGFAVPRVLVLGYAASGDTRFLEAAVRYIVDWSKFEARQVVPRGFVLNDHATASRAVVLAEVWRHYRGSPLYRAAQARELLAYAQVLMRRLGQDRLYEFRTNHGLMQTLSLLHVTTAFPLLPEAGKHAEHGTQRLLGQLEYFIGPEGIILEHSPGYHVQFIGALSAAWRFLALQGVPVPPELEQRYRRGVEFAAALQRPDGTLPPIGDTHDVPYGPALATVIDPASGLAPPVAVSATPAAPAAPAGSLVFAPVTGWAVIWSGLEAWPDIRALTQTVLMWADFPSRVHKHPDDMGLAIWAGGHQWVRSLGYWPFDDTRAAAITWRGSNAPHWIDEMPLSGRHVALKAHGSLAEQHFFDLERSSPEGDRLRRQVLVDGGHYWAVIDSFDAAAERSGEIVWRFAPGTQLTVAAPDRLRLTAEGQPEAVVLSLAGQGTWRAEVDPDGSAEWNGGLQSDGKLVRTAAVRIVVEGGKGVVLTELWRLPAAIGIPEPAATEFQWSAADDWTIRHVDVSGKQRSWVRKASVLSHSLDGAVERRQELTVPDETAARQAMDSVLDAYARAAQRYGPPFDPMLARRTKVTAVVLASATVQWVALWALPRALRRWRLPLAVLAALGWGALALFLFHVFLG